MTAAVILAAGESSRLDGRRKQLVRFGGRTLLRRAVDSAIQGGCDPVVVVLGSGAESMVPEVDIPGVVRVVNEAWEEGVASSIRAGIARVEEAAPEAEAVMLLVCDQPLLDGKVIAKLRQRIGDDPSKVAACEYAGTLGVPAAFGRNHFAELKALRGEVGAKPLLLRHADEVVRFSWPDGAVDVDRPEHLP